MSFMFYISKNQRNQGLFLDLKNKNKILSETKFMLRKTKWNSIFKAERRDCDDKMKTMIYSFRLKKKKTTFSPRNTRDLNQC